jgi:hypothetical protein
VQALSRHAVRFQALFHTQHLPVFCHFLSSRPGGGGAQTGKAGKVPDVDGPSVMRLEGSLGETSRESLLQIMLVFRREHRFRLTMMLQEALQHPASMLCVCNP